MHFIFNEEWFLKKALNKSVEAEKELDDAMKDFIDDVDEPILPYGKRGGERDTPSDRVDKTWMTTRHHL